MTGVVSLRPLTVDDADEMSVVLSHPGLYEFTGGTPPTADELRRRYTVQTRGHSADGAECWINLVVNLDESLIGYVQATVPVDGNEAEIAWVIGRPWQRRGHAQRAVQLLLEALAAKGVRLIVAHIHPLHVASVKVAAHAGLAPTDDVVEGEVRWERSLR